MGLNSQGVLSPHDSSFHSWTPSCIPTDTGDNTVQEHSTIKHTHRLENLHTPHLPLEWEHLKILQLPTERCAGRTSSLNWDISLVSVLRRGDQQADGSRPRSPHIQTCSHRSPGCRAAGMRMRTHPAVGRLVHVPFHFLSVGHQVLHAAILQGCRIRCRENGLDTERTARTLNLLLVQCQHPAISHETREEKKPLSTFGHNTLLRDPQSLA